MKITLKQLRSLVNEAIQRLDEDTCPCGIERADCEYHRPQAAPSTGWMEVTQKVANSLIVNTKYLIDISHKQDGTATIRTRFLKRDVDASGIPRLQFGHQSKKRGGIFWDCYALLDQASGKFWNASYSDPSGKDRISLKIKSR